MKYSAALALAIAPLALAKSVRNVYPNAAAKRDGHLKGGEASYPVATEAPKHEVVETPAHEVVEAPAHEVVEAPAHEVVGGGSKEADWIHGAIGAGEATKVIVIWAHPGGEAAETTTIHEKETVTVTEGAAHETAAPTEGGAGAEATHHVIVGGDAGLVFTPPEIQANVGDMVVFEFMSQMHTATQSSFDKPCDPLEGGMDTDTQPNPNNTISPPPMVAMQVMAAEPLWFYCKTGNHCGQGMVFSINPTAEKSHAQFQAKAIEQKGNGEPSAIVGGDAPPPPAESAPTAAPESGSPTEVPAGIETGNGKMDDAGSCHCAVTCANGQFPAMEAQGMGNFGGYAGGIPASMMEAA